MTVELPTRRTTTRLGRALSGLARPGDLLLLEGDLGAGKTFLARALCRGLGVPHDVPITSPTFTLVHEHAGRFPICHADLYRLREPGELRDLGLRERRGEGALVVIEWGGPHLDALGGDGLIVRLVQRPGEPRRAEISATGPRSRRLLGDLHREIGQSGRAC